MQSKVEDESEVLTDSKLLYTQHLDSKPSNKTDEVNVNIFIFKVTLTIVFRNTYEIILY